MADALSALLDSPQPERLATGFVFTEGPLWHPEGFYYFVDIRQSRLHRVFPGKAPELVRDQTGDGNGTTFDLQGRLVICEGGNRRVLGLVLRCLSHISGSGGRGRPLRSAASLTFGHHRPTPTAPRTPRAGQPPKRRA